MISDEAVEAAAEAINAFAAKYVGALDPVPLVDMSWLDREHALEEARAALEAAAPYILAGEVEWTVFRASDGENGSPAENLRYSTKAGAQESIDSRYSTPELWEPRSRVVGEWRK